MTKIIGKNFFSASYIASIEAVNQGNSDKIRISDDDLFKIETLELSQLLETIFLSHGYLFVEDILDKLNQKHGKENILFMLKNDETWFQELMDKLKEHGHL